jgi:predicted metalloprotease with PDZ domain
MEATAAFLPQLPVDRYAFLFYIADYREAGRIFTAPNPSLKDLLAFARQLRGKGFGALEHGNSSVYFLPDFGVSGVEGLSVESMIKDVAIHEFMHIITPLGLHSQHIGDFDFVDPVMSRHLWLYEGITEYFAGLIQVQGGLMTPGKYFSDYMRGKVRAGDKFPEEKMSFAEMSARVLEKKYHKYYNHVYDRGAVLGLLLDIEIIRLTEGRKTLRDVVLTLRDRYGAERSFDEAGFIREFVAEVHPDLQGWFDAYIEGRTDWDLAGGLLPVGVLYRAEYEADAPRNPVRDNDVRMDMLGLSVSKTGKKEWAGLQPGDRLLQADVDAALQDAEGNWLPEGTQSSLRVTRKGAEVRLPLEIRYETVKQEDGLEWLRSPSAEQARLRAVWLGKE